MIIVIGELLRVDIVLGIDGSKGQCNWQSYPVLLCLILLCMCSEIRSKMVILGFIRVRKCVRKYNCEILYIFVHYSLSLSHMYCFETTSNISHCLFVVVK